MYNDVAKAADGAAAQALMRTILIKSLSVRGFIVSDLYPGRTAEMLMALSGWLREGKLKYREDVVQGLENAPRAFIGLLEGKNFGKLIVEISAKGA
jgi:hypothetical protein